MEAPASGESSSKDIPVQSEAHVCSAATLASQGRVTAQIDGRFVTVLRHAGVLYCMDSTCYHMGGPLMRTGDIEDWGGHKCIVCPWHHYALDLATGEGIYEKSKGTFASKGVRQRTHRVYERDGDIFVQLRTDGKVHSDDYATREDVRNRGPFHTVQSSRPRGDDAAAIAFIPVVHASGRYFVNPCTTGENLAPSGSRARAVTRILALLPRARDAIFAGAVETDRGSVYAGSHGGALAMLRVAQSRPAASALGGERSCMEAAAQLLANGCLPRREATFLEGKSGCWAVRAIFAAYAARAGFAGVRVEGGTRDAATCGSEILNLCEGVLRMPETECELLYGRVGYLYTILVMRTVLGDKGWGSSQIAAVAEQVFASGELGRVASLTLGYSWHGKVYLGACHGVAGIYFILSHCLADFHYSDGRVVRYRELLRQSVDALLALRHPSGNLPSSLGNERDELVQFCHGAAGVIPILCHFAQFFDDPKYLVEACKCGDIVWQRGLLVKGVGLCHGIAGNGYALLALYHATRETVWLDRAWYFADVATQMWDTLAHRPKRPYTLYEGIGGAMCFFSDLLALNDGSGSAWWPGLDVPISF